MSVFVGDGINALELRGLDVKQAVTVSPGLDFLRQRTYPSNSAQEEKFTGGGNPYRFIA
jgi:hypothetical protein